MIPKPIVLLGAVVVLALSTPRASGLVDDRFARNEAVRIALARPLSDVTFERVPLREVVERLRRLLRVNIHVQWTTLDDNGVSARTPITVMLKRVTGERLLRLILNDIDPGVELGFEIQDGVVIVSLREALAQGMSLRTYSARHLILRNRDPALAVDWSADELKTRVERFASALVYAVFPDSWNVNGGTGSLAIDDGLLIIRQAPPPPCRHTRIRPDRSDTGRKNNSSRLAKVPYLMPSNCTSNTNSALGGIELPAPRDP